MLQAELVVSRLETYVVALQPRALAEMGGLGIRVGQRELEETLERDPEIVRVRKLTPSAETRLALASVGGASEYEVVQMSQARAGLLAQEFSGQLSLDQVVPLDSGPVGPVTVSSAVPGLGIAALPSGFFTVTVTVVGNEGAPVAGVEVWVDGSRSDAKQITDANGQVRLTLAGETVDSLRRLVASPSGGYFPTHIKSPRLDPARNNIVQLISFQQQFPNFPAQETLDWGLFAVGVDQLPPETRGQGVKVGVVDSGIAAAHPDLAGQVEGGRSYLGDDPNAWDRDVTGHGTHVAGVIAGLPGEGGIRGVAPGAKLRAYQIFPGEAGLSLATPFINASKIGSM